MTFGEQGGRQGRDRKSGQAQCVQGGVQWQGWCGLGWVGIECCGRRSAAVGVVQVGVGAEAGVVQGWVLRQG